MMLSGHTPLPADVSNILPAMNQHFSKEIEDEANSYFQRIYNHTPHLSISIDDLLDMLKRFKDSSDKKEAVSVLKCMQTFLIYFISWSNYSYWE